MLLSVLLYLDISAPRSTCLGVVIAKTEPSVFEKCGERIFFSLTVNSAVNTTLLFLWINLSFYQSVLDPVLIAVAAFLSSAIFGGLL